MIDFRFGVSLSDIKSYDLEVLREWRNSRKIRDWCRQNHWITRQEQKEWFEKQRLDKSMQMFSIHVPGIDGPVGVCGLTSINFTHKTAEFSLYIAPEYQRRGFARRALQTLLCHGFKNLELYNIWGESFAGNPAIGMFRELGFHYDGTKRQCYFKNGKFIDAEIYTMLRPEFEEQKWKP